MAAGVERLPERVEGDGLVLRRWLPADAGVLRHAVASSAEHLRPWMSWMADELPTVDEHRRMLEGWEQDWAEGGDVAYGIFVEDRVAGSCGLHRRRGPRALEIGYWIHAGYTRRGLATTVARLLTHAAFSVPAIDVVEIHHDKANVRSAGIPRHLGFAFAGETPDGASAPAESGIDCAWRMERERWLELEGSGQAVILTSLETTLDVVQGAFEAFTRKDFEGWLARLEPDVEWVSDDLTGPRTYRGHAGVRQWAEDVFADLTDVELEIRELLPAGGDKAFISFDIRAKGRTSGISGAVRRGAVAAVAGGKITYYRSYMNEDDARVAAGLAAGR